MAQLYHVSGPCVPYVGTGNGGALEVLGVTLNGARISIERKKKPIMSDAGGPEVPVEMQMMGDEAYIEIELMSWDGVTLTKVLNLASGTIVEGTGGPPGSLMATGGFTHSLYIPSGTDDPWFFGCVTLRNPDEQNIGTEASKKKLRFYAFRPVAGDGFTTEGVSLYDRAAHT